MEELKKTNDSAERWVPKHLCQRIESYFKSYDNPQLLLLVRNYPFPKEMLLFGLKGFTLSSL